MKKILSSVFASLVILLTCQMSSCSKSGDNPVDQLVEIIDNATEQAKQIKSLSDLANIEGAISAEGAKEIIDKYSDYELTDADKSKLKKSMENLVKVAYEKSMKYSGINESLKKSVDTQVDMAVAGINQMIDNAKTLGELGNLK